MKTNNRAKYSQQLADEICRLLAAGALIGDVCQKVGVPAPTYYQWQKNHPEFKEAVEKALGEANIGAAVVIRRAMAPYDEVSTTTKTRTETKLRKKADGSQEPYNWVSTTTLNTTTHRQGDWRAALEFLKRRDPEHWADKMLVVVEPEHLSTLDAADISPQMLWKLSIALVQSLTAGNMNARQTLSAIIGEISGGQLMIDAEVLANDSDE